jgi:mono/diheme cytochrome c family protein
VRSTLLSDRCAVYVGLPSDPAFMGKRLLLTRPFLHVGYAIMAPAALRISQLDDLKGKTVGVEFRTGPHILLASHDDFQVSTFRFAEEVLEALRRGEVETAFVWGPMAGYYNKTRLGSAYQIIPVAGPGLQWQVAIGVKPGNEVLKEALEHELEQLQPQLLRLAEQYGFPLTTPVRLEARSDVTLPAAFADQPSPAPLKTHPFQGDASLIPVGRSLFNQHCAHCHSPNAMNPEPSTDLRRLQGRYRENMAQVFYTTVSQGRSTKGMPAWEGVLNADMIWQILTFLESVQHKP